MRILLVRHGESIANVDHQVHSQMTDCEIPLSGISTPHLSNLQTERGRQQSLECGRQINKYFQSIYGSDKHPEGVSCRMWVSPFMRARQTADGIMETAGSVPHYGIFSDTQIGFHAGLTIFC